jgi:hypothetical protein
MSAPEAVIRVVGFAVVTFPGVVVQGVRHGS